MAINKKLIHFEKRDNFDTRLANNEINETSIVFIKDTGELWTHGLFFCTTAIPKPHDHDDRYLKLTGGTMTGSINWGTGSTREILLFSTNSTWKSGLRYSWSTNTTVALWGKLLNTQFVWNAGTDEELNGTTTKTYDFLIGRDTSGTYNGKVVGRIAGNIIWHAGNDGSGSGLDADLLDGQHGSYYLKEANLEWGGKNFSGAYGPVDAAMIDELGANRAAFAKAAGIAVEYSRDGGATWTDYGLTDALKIGIFSTSTCIIAGKRTTNDVVGVNDQVRVRLFTSAAGIYTALNKFTIYLSTSGSTGCWCTIKARKQADYENNVETYTTYANNVTVSGWSGWNIINTNSITTYGNAKATLNGELIFIFGVTGYNGNGTTLIGLNISKIRCFGGLGWTTPSNMARDGHLYSYDSLQNATFPAQITATAFKKSGGTSSQFLKADGSVDSNTYITASSSITGNAASATEFASAQSITLTGDTTGTASSKAGWSIATTTNRLSGYSGGGINATIAITGAVSAGKINYYYGVKGGTSGLFTTSSDANAIIRISRNSSENYDSLLGLSSNGNLYYRYFNNAAPDTTTTWKQIAFTDSNITGLASYAANVGSAGTLGTNYVAASKVIAACNWYDTVTGSDTDSVINRWDEIVNFVAGFEETPDLATYLANNYLAKTGNSTASPMTGTIYVKDVNPLVLQSTNRDLDIWRVTGNSAGSLWDNTFGFYLRYNGTSLGNDNSLSLWANNQTGNDVEVYRVKLDGVFNFLTAPTINGTAISLTTHDHDDRYLKLIGGTLTGTLNLDSNTMGAVSHLTFNREYSYIQNKASGGKFCFLANNAAAGSSANSDLTIADGAVYPGTSGHTALGTSTLKFSQLHLSGAANIGGTLTAASSLYLTGLTEGTSDVTDDTELVTSYAGESGFANATGAGLAYRRKASKLYNYIKTKTDNLYSSNEDSIEYIVGTLTASTNAWLGVTKDSSLRVGKMIAYKLPFAGTGSAATLNLTLSGGGTTGAITLRRKNGNVTTHYSATEVIFMVYDGTYWQVNSYYDSDSIGYYHRRIYPNLKAGPNKIFPYTMIMLLPDGRWESIVTSSSTGTSKTRNTHGFLLGHVLLMLANATYNENENVGTYNIFSAHSGLIDHRYSFNTTNVTTNGTTGYKPVYIVGTIGNDGLFYLAETWWTQTLPTEEDGKVYIYVGDAYDTYRLTFTEDKPIYIYRNGGIRLYSGTSDNVSWSNITNKPESFTPASHNHDSLYVTSVGVTDDTTNHANLLRYVKNGTSTYFTVPFATNSTNATNATTARNANQLLAVSSNEVCIGATATPADATNATVWINYRSGYGGTTNDAATQITSYYFGNRKGATTGVTLYAATFNGNATSATKADNLNKSTLGYLYQSATTTTGSTGTVTATSGKIGVPIQFYGSQVNYALNNDLFYATVASNAITANTIYLGDDIKSKTFVKTSTHVPTGASSSSSSSGTSGESITYTAGDGIKIAGTLISTNTWTGTESLFAELANPSSYDLIYIIED